MLDLSPTKLLIIFVVVVILLGPKRLPGVARQLGAAWRKVREFHQQVDRELRQSMPDLPSSQDIVRFARSPVALLNRLADQPDGTGSGEGDASGTGLGSDAGAGFGAGSGAGSGGDTEAAAWAPIANGHPPLATSWSLAGLDADDPNLN